MPKKGAPTAKLNVLLLKKSVSTFADALKADHSLKEIALKQTIGDVSALYIKEPHDTPPAWQKFLAPVAATKLKLANASSSAVLFIKADSRTFAFCFGHGRSELKQDAYESGFGLKVALNRVHPSKLRSVDARTLENGVTTKRLQTSRDADQMAFGLDPTRDLLRQVVGQPDDSSFAQKVVGSDALTIHAQITAGGLGAKCKQLLDAFKDTKYKNRFEWVDHLAEVSDPALRQKLDERLAKALASGQLDDMHLAATAVVDWEHVETFKLGGAGRDTFQDLDIEAYAAALGNDLSGITPEKLKSYQVRAQFAGSDSYFPQGSVYSSLVWETTFKNQLFALVDGHWYSIDKSYAETVTKFIQSIPTPTGILLPDSTTAEKEGDYNARVANASTDLFLLDQRLVRPDGAATEIEFCDVFSKSKQLIHVKRKTRSATLSHLFAQGTISAQLFVQDATVRKQVKDIIRADAPAGGFLQHIPDGRPDPSDYEVVYAIVAKPNAKWPLSLPFFSQVNLMHSCRLLDGLGFKFALQRVNEM